MKYNKIKHVGLEGFRSWLEMVPALSLMLRERGTEGWGKRKRNHYCVLLYKNVNEHSSIENYMEGP